MKAIDYLCKIVLWKYALPRQLIYNFGYLNIDLDLGNKSEKVGG